MFAFFKNLHINLNVAIEKRENFDTMIERDVISVQNIDFFDIAIDKNSDFEKEKINDTLFERSRIIFDVNIEKNKNFDDDKNEKIIDCENVKDFDSKTDETTNC